jgi:cytochrome c-type biogenesis protein CcmH
MLAAVLVLAAPALASERQPTLQELEQEVMCPTCKTLLALSDAPAADRIRAFIRERIAAGDTKSEIKSELVAQFGEQILAEPPKKGFNLLAWILPFAGIAAAGAVIGALVWRSVRRAREEAAPATAGPPLDPELERRIDEELRRFD